MQSLLDSPRVLLGEGEPKLTMLSDLMFWKLDGGNSPMRKNVQTHTNMIEVLDSLVLNPKMTVAARAIGVSTMTLYRWLRLSREGSPEFQQIEWCGEVGSFHQFFE